MSRPLEQSQEARNEGLSAQVEQQRKEEPPRILQPERQESIRPASVTIAALTLLPGLSRGSGNLPGLELTPELRTLRLRVGLDPQDDYQRFQVELRSPGGKRVWFQDGLSTRATRLGRSISFNLPAKILEAGRYELSVRGTAAGTTDDLGYYYFEVQKK